MTVSDTTATAIAQVDLLPLDVLADERGTFTEMYRDGWGPFARPVQWNLVSSRAGTVRGVHVHVLHDDFVVVAGGRLIVGLRDLRRRSPTHGRVAVVEVPGDHTTALTIPKGVAHGFLFQEPTTILVGVNRAYDPDDELEVHWQDPDLAIPWPASSAVLSPRDAEAGTLSDLLARMEPWQPF